MTYEELLSAVRDRVSRFATYSDPEDVLDPAGTRDIAALWRATPQKRPEMWHAVGLLHYARHLLNSVEAELELSESMLDRVRDGFPDIPEQLRKLREAVGKPVQPYPDRLAMVGLGGEGLDVLNYAIFGARQHIRTLDAGTNELWRARMDLAKAYELRFHRTEDEDDLDTAIDMVTELMESTPTSNPNYPEAPSALGRLWQSRFILSSAPEDLDRSVQLLREALATNAETHENHPMHQANLGRALVVRSTATARGDGDIDEALDLLTEAVATTPRDDLGLGGRLSGLRDAHYARFARDHSVDDLDAVVELSYAAVDATPPEHSDYVERFLAVGDAHFARYLTTHHKDDVKAAIAVARRVVKGTRRADPYHMLARELLKAARAAR